MKEWSSEREEYVTFLTAAARVLAKWPDTMELYGKLPRPLPKATAQDHAPGIPKAEQHDWVWTRWRWACSRCRRVTRSRSSQLGTSRCGGTGAGILRTADKSLLHNLLRLSFDSGQVCVLCGKCGAYAESRPRLLRKPCSGVCPRGRRQAMRAFLEKRRHHKTKAKVISVEKVEAEVLDDLPTRMRAKPPEVEPDERGAPRPRQAPDRPPAGHVPAHEVAGQGGLVEVEPGPDMDMHDLGDFSADEEAARELHGQGGAVVEVATDLRDWRGRADVGLPMKRQANELNQGEGAPRPVRRRLRAKTPPPSCINEVMAEVAQVGCPGGFPARGPWV